MAAFVTRALAHTRARPAGVTAQALRGGKVSVSLRDANFAPVAEEYVEVFFVETADEDDARISGGVCDTSLVQRSGSITTRSLAAPAWRVSATSRPRASSLLSSRPVWKVITPAGVGRDPAVVAIGVVVPACNVVGLWS